MKIMVRRMTVNRASLFPSYRPFLLLESGAAGKKECTECEEISEEEYRRHGI